MVIKMTLFDDLKARKLKAMKDRTPLVGNILGVVIGQVQQDGDTSDAAVIRICQKIIKSNNETIQHIKDADAGPGVALTDHGQLETLVLENGILESFLPRSWTEDEVRNLIKTKGIDVRGAASEGAAMGLVTKALKELSKAPFDGKMVRTVVAALRQADN
jgi:uncharacterized protein YqeY